MSTIQLPAEAWTDEDLLDMLGHYAATLDEPIEFGASLIDGRRRYWVKWPGVGYSHGDTLRRALLMALLEYAKSRSS